MVNIFEGIKKAKSLFHDVMERGEEADNSPIQSNFALGASPSIAPRESNRKLLGDIVARVKPLKDEQGPFGGDPITQKKKFVEQEVAAQSAFPQNLAPKRRQETISAPGSQQESTPTEALANRTPEDQLVFSKNAQRQVIELAKKGSRQIDYQKEKQQYVESNVNSVAGLQLYGDNGSPTPELLKRRKELEDEFDRVNQEYSEHEQEWIKRQVMFDNGLNPAWLSAPMAEIEKKFPDRVKELKKKYTSTDTQADYLANLKDYYNLADAKTMSHEELVRLEKKAAVESSRLLPEALNALTLDTIDFNQLLQSTEGFYSKDGKNFYKGFEIGNEFQTAEGKARGELATTGAKLVGGLPLYAGISGAVKTGVSALAASNATKLATASQALQKAQKAFPLLTELTAYNALEEASEATLRKATGQEYTFANFLNGIKYGAVFGTAIQLPGKVISSVDSANFSRNVEKFLEENKGNLDNIKLDPSSVSDLRDLDLGGVPAFEVFKEARYAFLRGTKDGEFKDNLKPIGVIPPDNPGKQVITGKADPLIAEAKKYKSAEEFVKAQGTPVYHGTKANVPNIKDLKTGSSLTGKYGSGKNYIYVSENPNIADYFSGEKGGKVLEGVLTGNKFDVTDITNARAVFNGYQSSPLLDAREKRIMSNYLSGDSKYIDSRQLNVSPGITEYLKEKGFSSIKLPYIMDVAGKSTETMVLDSSKILYKSQLTDIWKEANKPKAPEAKLASKQVTIPNKDKGATGKMVDQQLAVEKFNLREDTAFNLRSFFDLYGAGERQVQTFGDVQKIAEENGLNPVDLLTWNEKNLINAEENFKLKSDANNVDSRMAVIETEIKAAKEAGDEGTIKSLEAEQDYLLERLNFVVAKSMVGGTEAGRTVASFRMMAKNTLEPAYWLRQAAKRKLGNNKLGSAEDAANVLSKEDVTTINKLTEEKDLLNLAKFVTSLKKSSWSDKFGALYKAGLLTNPSTQVANFLGTAGMSTLEQIKNIPAAALDYAIYKTAGLMPNVKAKRTTTATAPQVDFVKAGWEEFKKAISGKVDQDAILKWDEYEKVNFDSPIIQKYVDGVFKALNAVDSGFHGYLINASLYEQAKIMGMNNGLKGKDLKNYILELKKMPTGAMLQRAIDVANVGTFRADNAASSFIQGGKKMLKAKGKENVIPLIDITMPFIKTPTNVAKSIFSYSPAGLLVEIGQQLVPKNRSQQRFVEAFGRSITGSSVLALGGLLYENGMMTGIPPKYGSKEWTLWQLQGKQPFSIKFNGTWISLDRIAPVGNLLALGADITEQWAERDPDASFGDLLSINVATALNAITEQTFLTGLASTVATVQDPKQQGERWFSTALGGLVPSLLGGIARGLDPIERDTSTWYGKAANRIPILRQELPPKIDILGQQIENNNSMVYQLLSPFKLRQEETGPLVDTIERLSEGGYDKAIPSTPGQEFTNKITKEKGKATDEIYKWWLTLTRDAISTRLSEEVQSETFQSMSPEMQEKYLNNAWNRDGAFRPADQLRDILFPLQSTDEITPEIENQINELANILATPILP